MAASAEDRPPPNYYTPLQLRLRYRMLLELHKSITNNNLDSFKSYWLHKYAKWETDHDDQFVTK
jgi:hypothetical protein